MTLPKAIGLFLLFLGPFCMGYVRAGRIRRTLEASEAMTDLIRFLQNGIETLRVPLPELFGAYESQPLESCGFLPLLRNSGWEAAIEGTDGLFSSKIKAILLSFGKGLGKSDVSHQSDLCRHHLQLLEEALKSEREQGAKDERLSLWLGVTGGLLPVILLI